MNKLIAVEACRCLAVIQDTIDVLERVMCVTPTLFTLGLDFDGLLGKDLSTAMRKYQQTRTTLESLRTELASVKAAGFKARLKSIQRKIEGATDMFQKAVKQLIVLLAGELDFIPKLEQAGVQPVLLQPQAAVLGGAAGRSTATASVAGDHAQVLSQSQTGTLVPNQAAQNYASINDLIAILKSLHHVVSIDMMTSADQEKQKKTMLAALAESERTNLAHIQSLRRELDITMGQCQSAEEKVALHLATINELLTTNAVNADNETTRLIEESSGLETQSQESYSKRINDIMPKILELQRKVADLCKKHRDSVVDIQRNKRRSEFQIRNWLKNYDERCLDCDNLIYKLRYEINISEDRIGVLQGVINAYNAYLTKRTSQHEEKEEVLRQFMLSWELPPVVYETQHKEFG